MVVRQPHPPHEEGVRRLCMAAHASMHACAGHHAHTSGLGLSAAGILTIDLCRTPVGSHTGQSLTYSPLW